MKNVLIEKGQLHKSNVLTVPQCPIHGMWGSRMTSCVAVPIKSRRFIEKKPYFYPYTKVGMMVDSF